MIIQEFNLNMIPDSEPIVVHVNQYDTEQGRFVIHLYNGDTPYTPSNASVLIEGRKPDGKVFAYGAAHGVSISGNTVTAPCLIQMTAMEGRTLVNLIVKENGASTGTFVFWLDVQETPINQHVPASDTEIPALVALAEEQAERSEAWAVGTKNGHPVSATDPTYDNNSKYWAEYAHAVSGINPMTASIMGIGKPDGYTTEVPTEGRFSAIGTTIVATVNPGGTAYTSDWLVDADDNVITPDSRRQYRVTVEGKTSLWWWTGTEYKQLAGGGHVVTKTDGTPMPQRANLELAGAKLTDESASDTTKVEFHWDYDTYEEADADLANIPVGARVLTKEADYVGRIDNALSLTSVNPVQNKVVTEAINAINDSFAVVTGTMASAVNTEVTKTFPTGFDGTSTIVVGNTVKNANSALWYSNHAAISVFSDQNSGIRIKTTDSGFCNQPFKILIKKI